MKKQYCALLILMVTILISCSHQKPSIVGVWKYEAAYDLETKKNVNNEDLKMWYGTMIFTFQKNNKYQIAPFDEAGTWNYNESKKTLSFTSGNNETKIADVIELNKDKMIINVNNLGMGFTGLVLKRKD
jgi:hypothetical protein